MKLSATVLNSFDVACTNILDALVLLRNSRSLALSEVLLFTSVSKCRIYIRRLLTTGGAL